MTQPERSKLPHNAPLYALVATVVFVAAAVVLVIWGDLENGNAMMLLGLLVTTLPSLVAAGFSERASRDIRNGVVVEKARQGALQAIDQAQVIVRDGPVVSTELRALTRLLEQNTAATEANTAQMGSGDRPTVSRETKAPVSRETSGGRHHRKDES